MKKLNKIALAMLASQVAVTSHLLAEEGDEVTVKTKGGLVIEAGDYSVQLGGRIQYDYNYATLNDVADEDDFGIRRARIYVKGDIGDDWSYKAQFNVGENNGGSPEDLYISYGGWGKAANLTIGKQKVQFGLEEVTSSKDITALERSGMTEQYAAGRQNSVRLHGELGGAFYSVSAFEDGDATGDDFGLAGRVAFNPINDDNILVHVGLGYMSRGGDSTATGIELAANMGSFSIQSEFFDSEEDGVDRDGYYVQAGYILTGETRPYKGGKFKKVKPQSDSGAWEVFARIEEGDGNHSDIELGRVDASAYTIGVNYYVNNAVRIGVNYSEGDSNEAGSMDSGDEFRVRFQLAY
jgi:phosphate-selective porin OprO/OprP